MLKSIVGYELQYDLPYQFIKKNNYTPFFPNYMKNNLSER